MKKIITAFLASMLLLGSIGGAAMEFILSHARAQGYTALSLWVLRDNARAVRFYRRHGFSPDGQAKTLAAEAPVLVERYLKRL